MPHLPLYYRFDRVSSLYLLLFCQAQSLSFTKKGEHNLKSSTTYSNKIRQRRGFTLAETLIVVGILVVLMGLLIPNLIQMQKELRQKELDAKAEIIYVAAQNELAKLRSGGNAGKFTAPLRVGDDDGVRMLSSNGSLSTTADWLSGAAEDLLHTGHHWVVIYNANTASVVEVFYSEKTEFENDYEGYRGPEGVPLTETYRFKKGAIVGYYNGAMTGGSAAPVSRVELHPNIIIDNGEKLIVTLACRVPDGVNGSDLQFSFTMRDTSGGEYSKEFSGSDLSTVDNKVQVSLTLDDLSSNATRFAYLYGEYLTPGDNLKLDLTVVDTTNPLATGTASRPVNSLFDNVKETDGVRTAEIKCGRHLQNLDESSGVADWITAARLIQTIDFGNSDSSGNKWLECYKRTYFNGKQQGLPKFKPIKNTSLNHFFVAADNSESAKIKVAIQRLNTGVARGVSAAGLFERFGGNDAKLEHIILESPYVLASGTPAGGLVGIVDGECAISGCGVYLAPDDYNGAHKKPQSYNWISGSSVGGLVGMLSAKPRSGPDATTIQRELIIKDSYAATTLYGTYAGGLVGSVHLNEGVNEGALTIRESYADCYATGRYIGGLVGQGAVGEISNSYAAGYLKSPVLNMGDAAGFVYGSVGKLENSYTVCDLRAKNKYAVALSLASTPTKPVFYLSGSSDVTYNFGGTTAINKENRDTLLDSLGTEFFRKGKGTTPPATPYNLDKGSRLIASYDYPSLKELRHYGDWVAELNVGSLVYYEMYSDGTFSFFGASVQSSLRDNTIAVGDGYGVFSDRFLSSFRVEIDGEVLTLNTADNLITPYPVFVEGYPYYIYPLPATVLNSQPKSPGPAGFWRSVTVTTTEYGEYSASFNPLLAEAMQNTLTVPGAGEDAPALTYPDDIPIRTARQLNALSKYYSLYWSDWIPNCSQELDIDYALYQWSTFCDPNVTAVRQQEPIGAPFLGLYDGNCHPISNIGFASAGGSNIGLFGSTLSIIRNVVVATDYSASSPCSVSRDSGITAGQTVHMGVLVGRNYGVVSNCAVAGYRINLYTYADSTLHVGGLVGRNEGTITNCSAVTPDLRVNATYSTEVFIGGLVGSNGGAVSNSYCLANLTAEGRESAANLSGFAGSNNGGQINGSYCASSNITSGTVSAYCFAPDDGGVLRDNYYLAEGSFLFGGVLRSYEGGTPAAAGCTPMSYDAMASRRWLSPVSRENSRKHALTQEDNYPFRGFVARDGTYVHYGDWQVQPLLGEVGVFYWEKEVGGSNDGYHISFLGTRHDGDTIKPTSASTLCTAHDDGGVITEFGYGYYYDSSFTAVGFDDANTDGTNGIIARRSGAADTPAKLAEAELEKQMPGYTFVPYRTQYTDSADADCLYLTQGKKNVVTEPVTSGTWTLTWDHDGDGESDTYVYTIAPFFANAMARESITINGVKSMPAGVKDEERAKPGSESNHYEIRSLEQFRYINWNVGTHNCDTLVDGETATQYPYLQHATITTNSNGGQIKHREEVTERRPLLSFDQTHDLSGYYDGVVSDYTPIAGMASSTTSTSYNTALYAWFGSSYDGRSYKIQNVRIESPCFTVGLFGVTLGADIKNVILYGDGTVDREGRLVAQVTRSTPTNKVGAYSLGGLIGLAYDYINPKDKNSAAATVTSISNCAVAGYEINDYSTNQQGQGEANVGGLIGVANVKLERCAAVVDIMIDATHDNGHAQYGSYIRVGGLTGAALFSVDDCYTGGSISITDRARNEFPYVNNFTVGSTVAREKVTHIYIGGLVGSAFSPNYSNITGDSSNEPDSKTTVIRNCYTYTHFPAQGGSVRAVTLFAGPADRYNRATEIQIINCHYLDTVRNELTAMDPNPPDENHRLIGYEKNPLYWLSKSEKRILTDTEFEETLDGNLLSLWFTVYNDNGSRPGDNTHPKVYFGPTKIGDYPGSGDKAYATLKAQNLFSDPYYALSSQNGVDDMDGGRSVWSWVTTEENENNVSGKYSFSNEPSQTGMDYPFPAVLRQVDDDDDPTNDPYIHYGAWPWPTVGAHWEYGRAEMDVFESMKTTEAELDARTKTVPSALTLTLTAPADAESAITDDVGKISVKPAVPGVVVESVTPGQGGKTAEVKLTGVTPGQPITVTEQSTGAAATVQLWPAEKDFRLLLDSPLDALPTIDDIEVSAPDKVQVVGVRWAQTEAGAEDRTAVVVTLRALNTGSGIILTEKKTGAYCSLTVTAHMGITAVYDDGSPVDTITVAEKDVAFTCSASSDFYTDNGAWTHDRDTDLDVIQDEQNQHRFTVRQGSIGSDSLTIAYTYNYWGAEIRATKAFPVRTMGYIGLSNGRSVVSRQRTETGADAQTEPTEMPRNVIPPQGADLFLFAPAADGDLAQFTVQSIRITENESDTAPVTDVDVKYFQDGAGHPLVTQDANYGYLGFTVRAQNEQKLVRVTLTLRDPQNGATWDLYLDNVRACRYVVNYEKNAENAAGSMLPSGVFTVADESGESNCLSACGFTRTGYVCIGWNTLPNPTPNNPGTAYDPEQPIDAAKADLTLYAQWKPIQYRVRLEPNNYLSDTAVECVYTYDETRLPTDPTDESDLTKYVNAEFDPTLPEGPDNLKELSIRFQLPQDWASGFDSWNTEIDGTGTMYEGGNINLTAQADDTITLYAQWKIRANLSLVDDGKEWLKYEVSTGDRDLPNEPAYAQPTPQNPHWTLNGWYYGDTKVLDADGTIAKDADGIWIDCPGITEGGRFVLQFDMELTARWNSTVKLTLDTGSTVIGNFEYDVLSFTPLDSLPEAYTRPADLAQWTFAGWCVNKGGTVPVLDADGKVIDGSNASGEGFQIADGKLTLEKPVTFYACWQSKTSLRLGDQTYFPILGGTTLAGYEKPKKTYASGEWELTGWYTEPSDDGIRLLDADGGVVAGDDSIYARLESGEVRLYPRWEKALAGPEYEPNGAKFQYTTPPFDLNAGDYFEVSMNLSACSYRDNILSFGTVSDLSKWGNNQKLINMYYPEQRNNTYLRIHEMQGTGSKDFQLSGNSEMTIRLTKDGIWLKGGTGTYQNGALLDWDNGNYRTVMDAFKATNSLVLNVGSQEGGNRSHAVYHCIRVVSWN